MSSSIDPSRIATNYYKLAHFSEISYTIFTSSSTSQKGGSGSSNDQSLLELELEIRRKLPDILLTYYNKCLYYFQFGHTQSRSVVELLLQQFPIQVKYGSVVKVDVLANPPKPGAQHHAQTNQANQANQGTLSKGVSPIDPSAGGSSSTPDESYLYLPFLSLTFLKAVKKLILFRLSLSQTARLFGNYSVISKPGTSEKHIIHIDPLLLGNGDLLVCITQKNTLTLFDSACVLEKGAPGPDNQIQLKTSLFVIYIMPSGIRCHLYYAAEISSNFTYSPPKNADSITNLYELSTGLQLNKDILWVKLIPNLQHLNNQTSKISRFIHSVDNKKFIFWPWELCLLQFGFTPKRDERNHETTALSSMFDSDPFLLILDFMDFNISQQQQQINQQLQPQIPTTSMPPPTVGSVQNVFSIPSAQLQPGTVEPENVDVIINEIVPSKQEEKVINCEEDGKEDVVEDGDDGEFDDLFGGDDDDMEKDEDELPERKEEVNQVNQNDKDEIIVIEKDQLHGYHKESEEVPLKAATEGGEYEGEKEGKEDIGEMENGLGLSLKVSDSVSPVPLPALSQTSGTIISATSSSNTSNNNGASYFDIPKDQMTINPLKSFSKPAKTPYNDPGAPVPVLATPFIFQTTNFTGVPSSAPALTTSGGPVSDTEDPASKSIFLPLHFNPIIKSNIDTKYGRGGKFYVAKENGNDTSKRRSVRATSVIGYEKEESVPIIDENHIPSSIGDRTGAEEVEGEEGDDDDESMNEDEESDEDEDEETLSAPLKLNTQTQLQQQQQQRLIQQQHSQVQPPANQPFPYPKPMARNFDTEISPSATSLPQSSGKLESPFGVGTGIGIGISVGVEGVFSSHIGTSISPIEQEMLPPFVKEFLENEEDEKEVGVEEVVNVDGVGPREAQEESVPGEFNGGRGVNCAVTTVGGSGENSGNVLSVGTPNASLSSSMSESSNCLPLILRCINVSTIPTIFIPNDGSNYSTNPTDFMYVDDEVDDGLSNDDDSMSVKLSNLDDFLNWLTPSIVFDMGMNLAKIQSKLELNSPDTNYELINTVDGQLVGFEDIFLLQFPNSYRINLSEFICDINEQTKKSNSNDINNNTNNAMELENQLSFLDDITNDIMLDPKAQLKRLMSLDWDSIYTSEFQNEEVSKEYKTTLDNSIRRLFNNKAEDDESEEVYDYKDSFFRLPPSKAKVHKQKNTIVNLNSIGLNFWQYLKLSPIHGEKNFQIVMISETIDYHLDCNYQFLTSLVYNYGDCRFGDISSLNLSSTSDLDGISGGIIQIEKGVDYYRQVNRKLMSMAEMIRLDLINKNNQFEFDRPLLLLFVNFDESIGSLVKIAKLCRNFKLALHQHQVPLVEVFSHVIPLTAIFKGGEGGRHRLRYISNLKLLKISMNLYNNCPEQYKGGVNREVSVRSNYTQLVKELPTKIDFKLMGVKDSGNGANGSFNGEVFLHLAYERSIDKNWLVAAWSDSMGQVTYTKSWYCSPQQKRNGGNIGGCHDLGEICDEIWDVSNELFRKLNQEIIKEMSGFGGKKFLVLTRINSIIPDDELVHWKRLSVKHKDVSLVVLSVNDSPKLLFKQSTDIKQEVQGVGAVMDIDTAVTDEIAADMEAVDSVNSKASESDFFKNFSVPESNNPSPNAVGIMMTTSPYNGSGVNFHSPQFFSNAPANFLSPQDFITTSSVAASQISGKTNNKEDKNGQYLFDPRDTIHAVLPKIPLPSFNSPTRLGMKIGYLLKEIDSIKNGQRDGENDILVYEVNLLSCSNYWNLNSIMQIILKQYKNLITLNDILGVRDTSSDDCELDYLVSGLIPWHVAAVSKTLEYVVHIDVEE